MDVCGVVTMLVVGLTGGIATGKSTVLQYLSDSGASTCSADAIVHELLLEPGVLEMVRGQFGDGVFLPDGSLDKKALAGVVFAREDRRKALEAILHPLVQQRMQEWLSAQQKKGASIAVCEIPLLFEAGLESMVDTIVTVSAEHQQQTRRLLNKGLDEKDANQRIAAQMPLEEKVRRSEYVIDNSGSLEDLKRQTDRVWEQLRLLSEAD